MQRAIVDFLQDEAGDWVALLGCGHRQHVRHQPPFLDRAWVTSAAGRAAQRGHSLECPLCDRFEWPGNFQPYKRTPEFTSATIPAGLLHDHATKPGVWARIILLEGTLDYHVPPLNAHFELTPERPGTVVPEVLHSVAPRGEVRFYVEFYRCAPAA